MRRIAAAEMLDVSQQYASLAPPVPDGVFPRLRPYRSLSRTRWPIRYLQHALPISDTHAGMLYGLERPYEEKRVLANITLPIPSRVGAYRLDFISTSRILNFTVRNIFTPRLKERRLTPKSVNIGY
ncbi:hypothetical protein [Burkholderia contaminans]|uniref:hypothetical protein n=1 Tax=Burkholderia contaminans TaxID=488447 RepID=UPI00114CDF72|nr:hypothetical protein [Burkholderia contaminans]